MFKQHGCLWKLCLFFCLCVQGMSCITAKQVTYFNNLPDSGRIALEKLQPPVTYIQVNDVLDIRIGGENEKTVQYINQYFGSAAGSNTLQQSVDADGNITLPVAGKIKVAGITKEAAVISIEHSFKDVLVNPSVTVSFSNFRFSILGEVKSPGTYTVPSADKLSIFQALSYAGDITSYGKRENVKIIRDVNGEREIISVNLNDRNILNSDNYYLRRSDVIYVIPGTVKIDTDNFQRTAVYSASITSLIAILLVIFRK